MSLSSLLKKASTLLGFGSQDDLKPPALDGEIVFCKNNVCVHPPTAISTSNEHHPGYLNIRSQEDQVLGRTLILTWIPNSTLKKNPRSIENSPACRKHSPRKSPRQEYSRSSYTSQSSGSSPHHSTPSSPSDPVAGVRKTSKDDTSISSEASEGDIRDTSDVSMKSQNDSGILSSDGVQNNARIASDKHWTNGVGKNVNPLFSKDTNIKSVNLPSPKHDSAVSSSDSDSPSTEKQLQILLTMSREQRGCQEQPRPEPKQRTSSGRSVTSIEMEGDSLMVVTEELEDSTFVEDEKEEEEDSGSSKDKPSANQNRDVISDSNSSHAQDSPSDSVSLSSDSSHPSPSGHHYRVMLEELTKKKTKNEESERKNESPELETNRVEALKQSLDLKLHLHSIGRVAQSAMPDIAVTGSPARSTSSASTATSGPDSCPPSPITPPPHSPYQSLSPESSYSEYSAHDPNFQMIYASDKTFADGRSPIESPRRFTDEQACGVFSVDLGQMRSLRIFLTEPSSSSGQLVISSRESQYKILHFHHGGLDRLTDIFGDWKFLAQHRKRSHDAEHHCKHFSVIRPYMPHEHCHPEEGAYEPVNEETWKQHMNQLGQIEDSFHLRKAIFFAGLEWSLRQEMWPFLLHYYPYNSTFEEREQIRNDKYIEYQNIRKQREAMSEEEQAHFWKATQCTVEKDVVRTDRSHPYFKGENNPNLEVLKNILLNYAIAHPHYGYTQGMSDLLAPVLAEVQNEADAYWCFEGLMQRTIFVSSPKDIDMDSQLRFLRELLKLMLRRFYRHLQKVTDGLELLFCHRWILLCFKREFVEADALRMWEACWAHYQTDYFHLFICVAIISVYGEDVVQQDLPADEMLLHFSSLSMHMNGHVILKKARGLLHQFRTLPRIPCTLAGLCTLCGPGMWDSGHVPCIQCVGGHEGGVCPYEGE